MYDKYKKVGKNKYVEIAQTRTGWNVSTYSLNGNKVRTHTQKDTRTLAQANKEYTRQKMKYREQPKRRPVKRQSRPANRSVFGGIPKFRFRF